MAESYRVGIRKGSKRAEMREKADEPAFVHDQWFAPIKQGVCPRRCWFQPNCLARRDRQRRFGASFFSTFRMRLFFRLLLLVITPFGLRAQAPANMRQLTDSIQALMRQRHIPGLMVGVVTRDSVLFSGGFGEADREAHRAVTGQTLFRLGSITKSFVALGILQLVEAGKIGLEDKLRDIAPEVPIQNPWESTNPVRVRNLLEHTTGFDDFKLNKMYGLDRPAYSTAEIMRLQCESMRCRWRPGERYSYSNVNYAIAGYLIKKRTGQEYQQYLTEHVLQPLGMQHSRFTAWSTDPDRDVREYITSSDTLTRVPSVTFLIGPAGSLWSCADDMVKFLHLFLRNGEPIVAARSLRAMETPRSSLGARAGLTGGYALGNEEFGQFRGHDGLLGVCRASYRYNRALGVGFVIASNGNGLGAIESLLADYLIRHPPAPKSASRPLDYPAIAPYVGYYQVANPRHEIIGFTERLLLLKVEMIDGTLYLNMLGKKRKLVPMQGLTFRNSGDTEPTIAFTQDADHHKMLVLNDRYCEQVPAAWAIGQRVALLLLLAFALSASIPALTALGKTALTQSTPPILLLRVLPLAAMLCLAGALLSFGPILGKSYLLYQLRTPTARSVGIFIGTLLFGGLSLVNVGVLVHRWGTIRGRWRAAYWAVTAFSLVTLASWLLVNGWIGLRTWAM
jgi:CubicO group peptidase (beta-lactamase class C family)